MSEVIFEVTVANYEEKVVQSELPVVLNIGATWCVDCRRIEPYFKEVAQKYVGKVLFAHCNFDTESALNEKFKVRHIPTILLLRNGEIIDVLVEPKQVALFKAFIEKHLEA